MNLNTPTDPRTTGRSTESDLDALRALRSADTEQSLDAEAARLSRGLARLEREIDARGRSRGADPAPAQARPRRRRAPRLLLGGVAAVAALGIAAAVLGSPAAAPPASAAELLGRAATHVSSETGVEPGQYLRIEERWVDFAQLPLQDTELLSDGSRPPSDPAHTVAFLTTSSVVKYIPADRSGDWIVRYSGGELGEMLTHRDDPVAERSVRDSLPELGVPRSEQVWPGGGPPVDEAAPDDAAVEAPAEDPLQRYRDAPREAEALLDYATADIGTPEGSPDAALFEWLLPLVADSSHPPELRAAAFDALAQLAARDDAEIVLQQVGDQRSVISFPLFSDAALELVFSASGELREYRTVVSEATPRLAAAPPGTVISSMTPRITVVEAVPPAN